MMGVRTDQFIDSVQTTGIIVIAAMLMIVGLRFMRAIDLAAEKIKAAIGTQHEIQQAIERMWLRIEAVEKVAQERQQILPTAQIKSTLAAIGARLDRLEALGGPHGENSSVNH